MSLHRVRYPRCTRAKDITQSGAKEAGGEKAVLEGLYHGGRERSSNSHWSGLGAGEGVLGEEVSGGGNLSHGRRVHVHLMKEEEGGRQREQQAQKWEDKSGLERQAQREVEKGSDKDEIHSHG